MAKNKKHAKDRQIRNSGGTTAKDPHEAAINYLLDPVSGNNAQGREVLVAFLKKDFAVGSEDTNDIMFVGNVFNGNARMTPIRVTSLQTRSWQ